MYCLRKLRILFNNVSIFYKYGVAFTYTEITPLIAIVTFTYLRSEKAILNETELRYQQFTSNLSAEVNRKLHDVEEISIRIFSDPEVQDFLSNRNNYGDYLEIMKLKSRLALNFHDSALVDLISIMVENGQVFSSRLYSEVGIKWEELMRYSEDLNLSESKLIVLRENNGTYAVYNIRRIYSMDSFKFKGFILIRINPEALMQSIGTLIGDMPVQILLMDDKDRAIYNKTFNTKEDTVLSEKLPLSDIDFLKEVKVDSIKKEMNGGEYFIALSRLEAFQWKLAAIVNFDRVAVRIKELRKFVFFIGLPCTLVACMISVWLTLSIVMPIRRIIGLMREVEQGNFEIQMNIERNDEIGKLAKSFIKMVNEIKMLFEESVNKERQKHEAELFALQMQISPHFLYNSLNSIKCLSLIKGQKDIADMCSNLMGLLKVSFKGGTGFIRIEDELNLVKQYVNLMQYRYGKDAFSLKITADSTVMDCMVPRLLLQPFVENAINHGIDISKTGGEITIVIKDCGNNIYFEVADNGMGMSEEGILKSLEENSDEFGIGLRNVYKRIKLYFGEQYDLKIKSALGKGTKISFTIPRKTS